MTVTVRCGSTMSGCLTMCLQTGADQDNEGTEETALLPARTKDVPTAGD